jgi:serine/threonine protein kinase
MTSEILLLQDQNPHYQLIGKGGFGSVFKVFNSLDNQYYAIKQIRVSGESIDNALKEIRILASLSHPNIIRYCHSWISSAPCQDYFSDDEEDNSTTTEEDRMVVMKGPFYFFNIQMEFCVSTLRKYLSERSFLDLSVCSEIVCQIVKGLHFLHANSIIHRDLKPDNVLISSFKPFHIKITDFGLAKRNNFSHQDQDASTYAGSVLYSAPEQFKEKSYSYASDVYSLGIIMSEIQHLFHTDMERIIHIRKLRQERMVDCLYFKDLIHQMTDQDPTRRPTIGLLRNQFFFTDLNDPVVFCRDIVWQVISSVLVKSDAGFQQQCQRFLDRSC